MWSLPQYQPVSSSALPRDAEGYRVVRGRVVHVGRARKAIWLDLAGGVGLRIDRSDLAYFRGIDLDRLKGEVVTARGFVHPGRRGPRMAIRFPLALDIAHDHGEPPG